MATEQLAEQAAEGLDEVAVTVEKVADATRRITGRDVSFLSIGFSVGVAAGFAAGFYIAEHRLKTKYSKLAFEEISRIREHYYGEKDKKKFPDEDKPPINEVKVVVEERPTRPSVPVSEPRRENVFQGVEPNEEWNYQTEISQRTPDAPYIIHLDEFRENTVEHDQVTYTYYESDDVMSDSRDQKIEEPLDETFGLGNLLKWGHGSNDSNIVYIRNERLGLDFEILRDRGSYAEQVSGAIRHSARIQRIQRAKRRFDDEQD